MTQLQNLYFLSLQPCICWVWRSWFPGKHCFLENTVGILLNWNWTIFNSACQWTRKEFLYGMVWMSFQWLLHNGDKYKYTYIIGLTEAPLGDSVPNDSCKWTLAAIIAWLRKTTESSCIPGMRDCATYHASNLEWLIYWLKVRDTKMGDRQGSS